MMNNTTILFFISFDIFLSDHIICSFFAVLLYWYLVCNFRKMLWGGYESAVCHKQERICIHLYPFTLFQLGFL